MGCLGVELGASRSCSTSSKINIVKYVEFIRWKFDGFDKE